MKKERRINDSYIAVNDDHYDECKILCDKCCFHDHSKGYPYDCGYEQITGNNTHNFVGCGRHKCNYFRELTT